MFIETFVSNSHLITFLVGWHACTVSFLLCDIIFAQLSCLLIGINLLITLVVTNLSLSLSVALNDQNVWVERFSASFISFANCYLQKDRTAPLRWTCAITSAQATFVLSFKEYLLVPILNIGDGQRAENFDKKSFFGEWIWVSFIFLQHSKGRETFVGINGALPFAQMTFVLNSKFTFFIK